MTDLDIIFKYFVDVSKRDPEREALIDKDDYFSGAEGMSRTMFGYFVDFYNKNGFPTILKHEDYLSVDLPEVYHGFMEYEYGSNLLADWKYHYGMGYTHGIYFTDDFELAKDYTMNIENGDMVREERRMLKAKIMSDKCLNYNDAILYRDIIREDDMPASLAPDGIRENLQNLKDFIDTIDDDYLKKGFVRAIASPSTIAVYLGFDYLKHNNVSIVLNRASLLIDEFEYNKFKAYSSKTENMPELNFEA